MEVFIARIRQLLPVLGSDILTPIAESSAKVRSGGLLYCRIKGLEAQGQRTANGFVVFRGSASVSDERPSAESSPYISAQRKQLLAEGVLIAKVGFLEFSKDTEFSSPSTAAAIVRGGSANGLTSWKTEDGTTLKELDEK